MTSLAEVTLSPLQAIAINGSLRTNERVEALYRLLHGPLLQTIRKFKDIDCEATATDTWIKVLSHLGAFVMPETSGAWPALQAWVYRIATNGATTQWRRDQFRRSVEGDRNIEYINEPADPLPTPEDRYEHAETIADQRVFLIEAMRSFSPRDLACILIGDDFPATPLEVMEYYGMTPSVVKALRFRKFSFLRNELVAMNAQREYPVDGIPGHTAARIRRTKAQLAEAAVLEQALADARPKQVSAAFRLLGYLHERCHTTGDKAGTSVVTYTHDDAAQALNRSVRRIKVRMTRLVNDGLVTTRATPDGLIVTITGYVAHTTAEGTRDAR